MGVAYVGTSSYGFPTLAASIRADTVKQLTWASILSEDGFEVCHAAGWWGRQGGSGESGVGGIDKY